MAIKIQLKDSLVDIDLGGKVFQADVSDKNVEAFVKSAQEMENLMPKIEESKTEAEIYEVLGEGFRKTLGVLFEENPYDYILSKVGRVTAMAEVLFDIREGVFEEVGRSTEKRVAKYATKPQDRKKKKK